MLTALNAWTLQNFGSTALSNLNLTNANATTSTGCAGCTNTGGNSGTINFKASMTVLACSPTTATTSSTVNCTATVTTGATGQVTFKDGGATLSTLTLASGTVLYAGTFTAGTHNLTAAYAGDSTFSASTSNAIVETVLGSAVSVSSVAAGNGDTLALKSDGTVWAWGANLNGQLGNNSTTDSHVPVQVTGLTGVTTVAAGSMHTVALRATGRCGRGGPIRMDSSGTIPQCQVMAPCRSAIPTIQPASSRA